MNNNKSEGPSMLPTLSASGDYILIDKLSSKKSYRKGKVVIAKPQKLFFPDYEKKRNYKVCKRIVGEPNEIIDVPFIIDDIIDGQVVSYIQPYKIQVIINYLFKCYFFFFLLLLIIVILLFIYFNYISPFYSFVIKVPEGHVWLQGDNIYDSVDSRDYGPVPIKDINGVVRMKVLLRYNDIIKN